MRCLSIPTRTATIKKRIPSVGENVERLQPPHTTGGNVK